jgi:TolB protein
LVFTSIREQEDVFISRSDGSGLRQLTNDPANDRRPTWSPDGKQIAFDSTRSGSYQVWTINPDGSGLQQLTEYVSGPVLFADWSPDGTRMAAVDNRGNRVFIFDPWKPWKAQTPQMLPPPAGEFFGAYSWLPD